MQFITNAASRMSIGAGGNVTINAPSANGVTTLTVISSSNNVTSTADVTINRAGSTANQVAQGPNIQLDDVTNVTGTILQNSGGQTELWQYNGGWNQILVFTSGRQLSLPQATVTTTAPAAGGAGALPATPAGYVAISIAGVARRIPFYT